MRVGSFRYIRITALLAGCWYGIRCSKKKGDGDARSLISCVPFV